MMTIYWTFREPYEIRKMQLLGKIQFEMSLGEMGGTTVMAWQGVSICIQISRSPARVSEP